MWCLKLSAVETTSNIIVLTAAVGKIHSFGWQPEKDVVSHLCRTPTNDKHTTPQTTETTSSSWQHAEPSENSRAQRCVTSQTEAGCSICGKLPTKGSVLPSTGCGSLKVARTEPRRAASRGLSGDRDWVWCYAYSS